MIKSNATMTEQIAQAAIAFEQRRTGHAPESATVVLSESTLVIRLRGALSPAERDLAESSAGARQVQEFHRQLFLTCGESMRQEIKRITGVEVREAAAAVEPTADTVVHAFTNGTVVQVYLLAGNVHEETWNGSVQDIAENGDSTMLLLNRKSAEAVVVVGSKAGSATSKPL